MITDQNTFDLNLKKLEAARLHRYIAGLDRALAEAEIAPHPLSEATREFIADVKTERAARKAEVERLMAEIRERSQE